MINVWGRIGRMAPAAGASYPLDGLDDDLWAAWAPYRLLSSFSSAYIRVRRSNDNAEADCASDAEIASHCGANNGFIVTLYDQTGNSRDATQTTNASQPKIYNGSAIYTDIGGMPCAQHDGANHFLTCPTMVGSGITTAEAFAAGILDADPPNTGGSAGAILGTNSDTNASHTPWTNGDVYETFCRTTRLNANPTDALTSTFVWGALSVTSGDFKCWINSQEIISSTSGSFALPSTVRIGRSVHATKYYLKGKIGAVLIYSANKSSDRTAIRSAIT